MKIKYFLIMLLAFVAISANAQTFQLTLDKSELIFTVTSETECSVKCGLNYEKNISIPATVTYAGKEYQVTSIEENGFKNHGGITSVNIPTSVTSIGNYAFYGCSALTSIAIPNSVTTIGTHAFMDCDHLITADIPDSVTSIGVNAFYNCTALTTVTVPSTLTAIEEAVFYNCPSLTSVTIPSTVTSIGAVAFRRCSTLTSITIPESVTSIGTMAFTECSGLTSVTIPSSVTSMGNGVFSECTGLTSVSIPNSLTSIGDRTFQNCTGLTSVTIPNSVTSIGKNAFDGCPNLADFTVEDGDTSIKFYSNAIYNTPIKNLYIGRDWTFEASFIKDVNIVTLGEKVTTIPNNAFKNCTGLTSITIPNSVSSIGNYAFQNCTGLTAVTIPNSVTSIGQYAFDGCLNLADFTVEDGDTSIKFYTNAIYNTPIKNLYIGRDWTFEASFIKDVNSVTFGEKVTAIPNSAFLYCGSLTLVCFSNSITSIGSRAFLYCTGLTSVFIPNSVTSIDSYAFRNCTGLKRSAYPNTLSNPFINGFAVAYESKDAIVENGFIFGPEKQSILFAPLTLVGEYTIPSSVTSIDSYAFSYCTGLTSVIIPNSVTSIGSSAFQNCTGLTSVIIPNTVTSIGSSAFQDCTGLKKSAYPNTVSKPFNYGLAVAYESKDAIVENGVVFGPEKQSLLFVPCTLKGEYAIPNSVTSIGNAAFILCSGLKSIELGENLATIGANNLTLTNLTKLIIHATTPPSVEGSIASQVVIDVPAMAYPNYYADAYWKTYLNQMTINQIPKIEGPVDGTFIPGADLAYQNLTFVDPKTGRAYVTKAYGMDGENPYIYIEDYQTYPIAQPKPGEEDAVVAADMRFVIPNNFIASKTAKVGDELISADENMMWICETIPTEPVEGVKYYNIAVAGAKLNIADPKTGNIYQTQAHGLNTEIPVLHLTNFDTLPFATLQESDQNTESANRFYVPANLTFTNNAPEWMADATFEKPMLWVCDAIPEEPGDAQFFSIPVSAVNLCDEFKANYTQIYIEDGGQPLYLYQNLPARFKQDMGETCAIDLYLGRDAVNKSESTAIFGLGAATNSETYPLKSVTLGSMVRNIYNNTFAYANQLMDITFAGDDCLQNIGTRAFEGLRWSKPIIFPKGLKEIGDYAFTENRFLNAISFSEAPQLTLREGAFQYCQRLASVSYASPISRISKYAFRYCESYNGEIDIKATIIEESAFERGLFTNIALNVGVLGASVFRNIPTITSVTGKIGCIDQYAFAGCNALKSLEGNFDFISSYAFSGCTNLNTIDVTGTGAIRQRAFGALQKLETVKLDINSIEDYAFYDNSYSSTYPVINTLTFGDRVQSIGAYAFYYLNYGKTAPCKIAFGSGLKNIGNYAFNYAYLDKVHFANVENGSAVMTVGDYAFNKIKFKNDILPVVSLGNTVKSIGNSNFQDVTLDNPVLATDAVFDLGTSIQSIGNLCFYCIRESSVVIPGSASTIGYSTLEHKFHKIVIAPGTDALTLNNHSIISTYIELNRDIKTSNKINNTTIFWAYGRMSIAIDPESTYSGAGSQDLYASNLVLGKYCKNYPNNYSCQFVEIQDGVENINSLTCSSSSGSRRIILPPSLGNITTFAINNNVADALIISDGEKPLTFGTAPKTGNLLNEIYVGRTTSLSNPANGGVFQGFPYLTKAVIGPKVAEITPAMFKDCPKITNIIFGREDVAEGEDAIAEMQLKKIGANAFQNCKGLQVLSLPETLEAAGADAFHGFQGLQRIVARGNTPALGTVTWGTSIENNAHFFYPTAAEAKYRASDMFYPFFNAEHAATIEGNIANRVEVPMEEETAEELDDLAAGTTFALPAPKAFTEDLVLTPDESGDAPTLKPRRVRARAIAAEMPLLDAEVNTKFYWFAPRPDIASVDANGKVTVLKNEPAEIWVYALDGSDRKAVIGINQPVLPGDLSRNNKLDASDILLLMMRLAKEGQCSKIADVNSDGELSTSDLLQLMINTAQK